MHESKWLKNLAVWYLAMTGVDIWGSTLRSNSPKININNDRKSMIRNVEFERTEERVHVDILNIKVKGQWNQRSVREWRSREREWAFSNFPGWHFLMDLPPLQSLDRILRSTCFCLVLTGICALGKSPLLCSQLLFLLQVEDEAGFPHLTPYSRGKIHVEEGSCRGHVFWSQSSEDGQDWLRSSKMMVTNF